VSAEVFFATEVLDVGAGGYGVLMAAWTLGMVAGAIGIARLVPKPWLAAGALLGIALQGAGLLGAAAGATIVLALAGFLVGGAAHGVKNVLLRTLIHESVSDAVRGRVFASYNAARNGAELSALVTGGVLVGLAGSQVALALSGAVPLAIALAALTLVSRRETMPTRRPAYAHDS
jgi:MFS family permease